jgi:Mrp family chromosome partitioning ATPase
MSEYVSPAHRSDKLSLDDLQTLDLATSTLRENRIVGFDNNDIRARPFKLLRTSFAKKMAEVSGCLVGITSATPAAGKSFLSLNLAISLSKVTEDPVFLVDLDLRRASIAEELGISPELGIESYLAGTCQDLAEIGVRINGTNLGVFPAIRRKRNTAELLATEQYSEMIERFRTNTRASAVLFDLPPTFANDDTMISLGKLDGYILVVDSGKTTKRQVLEVMAMLDPTPCLGTILNRYHGGFNDSYGYGYGSSNYGRYYE